MIAGISHEFAVFAVSTSFLGVSIAFFDFWADTLQWSKKGGRGLVLAALVFVLPLIFAISYPSIFIAALDLGGQVGSVALLGIFPALFVWVGRYRKYRGITPHLLPGGRAGLLFLILLSLTFLLVEFFFNLSPT